MNVFTCPNVQLLWVCLHALTYSCYGRFYMPERTTAMDVFTCLNVQLIWVCLHACYLAQKDRTTEKYVAAKGCHVVPPSLCFKAFLEIIFFQCII
jgi:hypothetical protein